MAFDVIVMVSLSGDEHLKLIRLSLLFNMESEFALHLVECLVDVHEFCKEVRSAINELFGQVLSGPVVQSVADIALPEAEDFANEVVLKELHAGEHIEHGRLLHPFWERKELSGDVSFLCTLDCRVFVLEHLHDTLCADCKVLLVKLFGVLGDGRDEVIWAEFGGADLSAVAV